MEIQSLSIVVPGGCPNACKFCVSRMRDDPYPNLVERADADVRLRERDYLARMAFARDNGCNNLILTGEGEPALNRRFLARFAEWNAALAKPFRWMELQTSGAGLDGATLEFLRAELGVSTVALSLSSIFDDGVNAEYNGAPERFRIRIAELCAAVKARGFNLRLSLNMTDAYGPDDAEKAFARARELGAEQLTFRRLYGGPGDGAQETWVREHSVDPAFWPALAAYVKGEGRALERLPYGPVRYSVDGISTVIDDDCMATADEAPALRYLILRPDCRLYTKWDDRGSLLF
ncbi:MAG: radical SAM protein [Spirochaetales bacterium]|nr:radical SAM protein [Spirochaetales bacterium]